MIGQCNVWKQNVKIFICFFSHKMRFWESLHRYTKILKYFNLYIKNVKTNHQTNPQVYQMICHSKTQILKY